MTLAMSDKARKSLGILSTIDFELNTNIPTDVFKNLNVHHVKLGWLYISNDKLELNYSDILQLIYDLKNIGKYHNVYILGKHYDLSSIEIEYLLNTMIAVKDNIFKRYTLGI